MSSSNGARRELSVGIVGAGFGGVGMGIRLREEALASFEIFERGDSVGGVWRANTYPGAACDVPSHLYSFSFAPGHRWSRRYAPQAEILSYLRECSTDYGIDPHVHLGAEVTRADFDPEAGRWTVRTEDGGGARVRPPGHRLRTAHPARDPAARRDRGVRRARLPLRRMGPRRRPDR